MGEEQSGDDYRDRIPWRQCPRLFVVFKNDVCCLYPNAGESFYDLAIAYASKGHFVHSCLYKILPYKVIKNP